MLKLTYLLLLCFQVSIKSYAAGESCIQAYTIIPDTLYLQNNFMVSNPDKSVWFSFVASATTMEIYNYETAVNPGTVANEIYAYSGNCNSLSLLFSKVIDNTAYGQRQLILKNLNLGSSYFIKILAAKSSSNLNISFTNYSTNTATAPCGNPQPTYSFTSNGILPSIAPGSSVFVGVGVTLTVGSNILIRNCKFLMGQGSRIVAPNGIRIDGGSRMYSCTLPWQGIEVTNGDVLIEGNSMISDADIAVHILSNGSVNIHEALFNRNNRSIVFSSIAGALVATTPINNVIITSRYFGLTYLSVNPNILQLKSTDPTTGKTYLEGYTMVGLINANITRPYCGIADFHTFSSSLQIGQFPIGTKDNNIFDNLDYGIISSLANTNCINNVFQFLEKGNSSNNLFPYYTTGIGVIADAQIGTSGIATPFTIIVGAANSNFALNSNTFYNCYQGIVSNYSNMLIQYNTFDGDGLFNQANQLALFTYPGSGGNLVFEHNSVNNIPFGTRFNLGAANFNFNSLSFSYNEFDLAGINNSGFGSLAMTFNGLGSSATSAIAKINNNSIINVKAGIALLLNGMAAAKSQISGNTISLIGQATSSSGGAGTAGIYLNFATRCNLTENMVTGDYTSGASNKYCVGIYLSNSKDCHLQCNTVANVRTGFLFDGNCTAGKSYVFTHNSMSNCNDGLVLANSMGGIGKNGSATAPADNSWSGFFDRSQTLSDNANFNFFIGSNQASYFYCRAGLGSTPTLNFDITNNPLNVLTPNNASGIYQVVCNNINNELLDGNDPSDVFKELIINDEEYPVLQEESEWLNKKYAYEQLVFDSSYALLNDPELNDFIDSMQFENIAMIAWIEELIQQNDYYYAQLVNNGLTPQNLIEQNIQVFNEYYLRWCENPNVEFSISEINDLIAIANQCVNLGGKAVLQSRIFLECILFEPGSYTNYCPVPTSSLRKSKNNKRSNTFQNDFTILLTPNPANNLLTFKSDKTAYPLKYNILDLTGKSISEAILYNADESINVSQLRDGIYFIKCQLATSETISRKLVVVK